MEFLQCIVEKFGRFYSEFQNLIDVCLVPIINHHSSSLTISSPLLSSPLLSSPLLSSPLPAEEISTSKRMQAEFHQLSEEKSQFALDLSLTQLIREAIKAYAINSTLLSQDPSLIMKHEKIIALYLISYPSTEFHPSMIPLLGPFIACQLDNADIYYSYTALLDMRGWKSRSGRDV